MCLASPLVLACVAGHMQVEQPPAALAVMYEHTLAAPRPLAQQRPRAALLEARQLPMRRAAAEAAVEAALPEAGRAGAQAVPLPPLAASNTGVFLV